MDVQRHLAAIPGLFSPTGLRRGSLAVIALVSTLLLVACSSSASGSTPTPGVTSPEPTATAVIEPDPTPTPSAATATLSGSIQLPPCNTGSRFTSGSLGTAPGPTPTPVPEIGSRDAALVSRELSAYFTVALPIADHLADWNSSFNSDWSAELSVSQQVQNLLLLVRHIELTCDAIARIIDVPIEAAGFDALLREAIRVRHAWVRSAFDQLECCNNGVSAETDAGNADTSGLVAELSLEAADLMRNHGASVSGSPVLSDEAIGIEITTEEDWLMSADGLSPVLLAPFEKNRPGLLGLGPQRWQLGAAVRVRRLRNPEPIDVDEASNRFRALVTQQGSVTTVEQTSVDGVGALRHILNVPYLSWSATVTVIVAGDFTYFVETGCPLEITGACESVGAVAGSLALLPRG